MASLSPASLEPPASLPGVPEVRAVSRAVAILRAFKAEKADWTLGELAREAELDKGTTRRLLHTLCLAGLVEHDQARKTYTLTLGVLELAAAIHRGSDLQDQVRPVLSELADLIGGTAFLWVFEQGLGVCLDRVIAPRSIIKTLIAPGNRISLNCGAGPRVLLAYVSEPEREQALALEQTRRTARSITNPASLRTICAAIRKRGYELVADDFVSGLAALGVPILDGQGRFRGAISITNLTDRFELSERKPVLLGPMQTAARRLARRQIGV